MFESSRSDFADRIQHTIGLQGKWRFFPYTQAYIDASIGFYGALGNNTVNGMTYKISSNPLRIIAGVDTLITPKTTVNAYIGYANGFYDSGPSFNTPIGGLTLGWRYAPFGRVVLRYAHEARDSINANYYRDDGISVSVNHTIRGNVLLSGGPGVHFRRYDGISPVVMPSSPTRDDFIFDLNLRAAWMIQDRLSLYAEYRLESVQTDFRQVFDGVMDDPSYIQHVALAGLAAAF